MIQIDKDIPLPSSRGRGNRHSKYPWRELEVGDSFLHECLEQRLVGAQAASVARRLGHKYATRKTPEGIRVWRIA